MNLTLPSSELTTIWSNLPMAKSPSLWRGTGEASIGGQGEAPFLVIDRMSVDDAKDAIARLVDSAETAFFEGHGEMRLMFPPSNICYDFSMRFEADGMTFEEPSDQLFSFNSPVGACPECQGFGRIIGIDEEFGHPQYDALRI